MAGPVEGGAVTSHQLLQQQLDIVNAEAKRSEDRLEKAREDMLANRGDAELKQVYEDLKADKKDLNQRQANLELQLAAMPQSVASSAGLDNSQFSSNRPLEYTGHVVEGVDTRRSLGSFVLYRQALLENIGDLLWQHGLIMLRASPRAGKSSILDLCCAAVAAGRAPKFHSATYFSCTRLRDKPTFVEAFEVVTKKEWKAITGGSQGGSTQEGVHLICIDEFHLSFPLHQTSCQALYTAIKDVMHKSSNNLHPRYRILAAAIFGSKASQEIPGNSIICTPPDLTAACTITLQPTTHNLITTASSNNIVPVTVGLLLSAEEREQMWQAFLTAPNLQPLQMQHKFQDPATKTQILALSGGHVGTLAYMLDDLASAVKIGPEQAGYGDDVARFKLRNNSFYWAVSIASSGGTLRSFKGDLSSMGSDPSRQLIRALLYEGKVNIFTQRHALLKDAALRMVRDGYVALSDQGEVQFLSPMHERYYRHTYFSQQLSGLPLWTEGTLKEFIKVAIERMSSQQLKQSRSIGVNGDLLERAYQMEFYTAVQSLLPASYGLSADVGAYFGIKGAYCDFYVYHINLYVGWAIELLRRADQQMQHVLRFTEGKYKDLPVHDWAVVDFFESHVAVPSTPAPYAGHYYQVKFQDVDFTTAVIMHRDGHEQVQLR